MPNEEKRKRDWFITINQNAECFSNLENCLNKIVGKGDKYAYILHDKDDNTKPHYHVVLLFKNARGWNSVLKTFDGGHIEEIRGLSASCNYLMHNGKPEKFHYPFEEVKSNSIDWFKNQLTEYAKETFIEDKLLFYVFVEKCDTYLKLCLRFGASQLSYGIPRKIEQLKLDFLNETPEEQESLIEMLKKEWRTNEDEN